MNAANKLQAYQKPNRQGQTLSHDSQTQIACCNNNHAAQMQSNIALMGNIFDWMDLIKNMSHQLDAV